MELATTSCPSCFLVVTPGRGENPGNTGYDLIHEQNLPANYHFSNEVGTPTVTV